ncbi:MAG: HAD-IIIA family hydrolase [Clostridia bacterium]|nr:HAD-IIIA family hydrolase [Clostridia bacterium]
MKIRAAIFDLDGTLLNTLDDLADSVNFALEKYNMPKRSVSEVRRFVGNGVYLLIKRAVPENTDEQTALDILDVFKKHYAENCENKTNPYDGITEMLRELKTGGIKTAVVSNKFDNAVRELCEKYFGRLIDAAIGEREGVRRKPCPDSVLEVMRTLNVEAGQSIYIGDSDVDIETAANAGLECVSVSWGFKTKEQLIGFGAKKIADNPQELLEIIEAQIKNP